MGDTPATVSLSQEVTPSDWAQAGRLLCSSKNSFCINSSLKPLPVFSLLLAPQPLVIAGVFGSACRGAGRGQDRGGRQQLGVDQGWDGPGQKDEWGGDRRAQESFCGDTDNLEALKPVSVAAGGGGGGSMLRLQLGADSFPAASLLSGAWCGTCNSSLESVTNTNLRSAT